MCSLLQIFLLGLIPCAFVEGFTLASICTKTFTEHHSKIAGPYPRINILKRNSIRTIARPLNIQAIFDNQGIDEFLSQTNQLGADAPLQQLAIPGLIAAAAWVYLTNPPGILTGIVNALLDQKDRVFDSAWLPEDLSNQVGRTLGKGTFGTAFEGYPSASGLKKLGQREGKVVLKRVSDDRQVSLQPAGSQTATLSTGTDFPPAPAPQPQTPPLVPTPHHRTPRRLPARPPHGPPPSPPPRLRLASSPGGGGDSFLPNPLPHRPASSGGRRARAIQYT
jgi:hypothetical protein